MVESVSRERLHRRRGADDRYRTVSVSGDVSRDRSHGQPLSQAERHGTAGV